MAETTKGKISLKTPADLIDAVEALYTEQHNGKIDAKTADALNTTLKAAIYLRAKLPMDYAKLYFQAQVKKIVDGAMDYLLTRVRHGTPASIIMQAKAYADGTMANLYAYLGQHGDL